MDAMIHEPRLMSGFPREDMSSPITDADENPAKTLAHAYLHAVCVDWEDGSEYQRICTLLADSRDEALPPMPGREPDSMSPHAAGGHGISWYVLGTDVIGYIADSRSGYRVPAAAVRALPKTTDISRRSRSHR